MRLPFTVEQFYGVFREYNEAVWPAQFVLVALALAAVAIAATRRRWAGAAISIVLALLWAWMAIAYHLSFFAAINPVARVFAGLCLAGAAVFVWQGAVRRALRFDIVYGARSFTGLALVVFALFVYPLWSVRSGHGYPAMPTFGLPCPTTIFTIGMLAFLAPPYPRAPFVVPVLWSLVGGQAAMLLDVPQDFGLFAAAAAGIVLLVRSRTARLKEGCTARAS